MLLFVFFFSSRRRHTRWPRDWSSDVCSSDLLHFAIANGLRWPNLSRVLAVNDFQPGAENTAHTQLIRYGFEHGVKRSRNKHGLAPCSLVGSQLLHHGCMIKVRLCTRPRKPLSTHTRNVQLAPPGKVSIIQPVKKVPAGVFVHMLLKIIPITCLAFLIGAGSIPILLKAQHTFHGYKGVVHIKEYETPIRFGGFKHNCHCEYSIIIY